MVAVEKLKELGNNAKKKLAQQAIKDLRNRMKEIVKEQERTNELLEELIEKVGE